MGENRTPPVRRTTVAEAAEFLGISAEAVRGRIRRGTLPVEREGGTVYVLIDQATQRGTTGDRTRTTTDQSDDRTDLLIAELQDRVRSLEEANRENRRIIAALTQRIPELPPPSQEEPSPPFEPPTATREYTVTPQPGRVGPQTEVGAAQESPEAPETATDIPMDLTLSEASEEGHEPTRGPETVADMLVREEGPADPREPGEALGAPGSGTARGSWWRRMFGA